MTSDKPNKINKQHNANMNLRIQNKFIYVSTGFLQQYFTRFCNRPLCETYHFPVQ